MAEPLDSFWKEFAATREVDPTPRFCDAYHFDDNEPSANELAELVLAGVKRATASLLWWMESQNEPLPKSGDLNVITNWEGKPFCVVETRDVTVVPYNQVTEEFAATEGEGNGSLRYWQEAHWAYFGRLCQRLGREPTLEMPVVCERFEVVYRSSVI